MSEILGTLFKYLAQILGVAAVVGLLYVVFGTNKVQTNITQVTQTQAQILNLYNGKNNYSSLTNTVVIQGKLAPTDMSSNGVLVNPWGGAVTIAVDTNAAQFYISEDAVPNDACAKIALGISNYVGLKINGGATYSQTTPLDPGTATTECNSASNSNTVKFTFGS